MKNAPWGDREEMIRVLERWIEIPSSQPDFLVHGHSPWQYTKSAIEAMQPSGRPIGGPPLDLPAHYHCFAYSVAPLGYVL